MAACPELLEMRRMSVKLDQELMRKAKIIAAARKQSVIDYLEEMLRPQIQRDIEQEMRKLSSEGEQGPKRKRGE
jgi:predicted transcriptional regulator